MADQTLRQFPDTVASPLVGREREQAALQSVLVAAQAGHGGLVLIGGEAGIGKTVLAEVLLAEAQAQGALVLVGRCYDLTETPPYGPWIDLYAHLPADHALPPLPAAFATPGTVGAVSSQAALFQQVLDFVRLAGDRCPIVLFLDDQHWADAASLDLLRFLAREVAPLPVLLLATYRDDELTRRHPLYALLPVLEREARAARLDLRRFDAEGVRALVADRYALADDAADRLVTWLVGRAEGNAFFTIQLLRALKDEGVLAPTAGGWALGDLGAVGLPAPLRQVLDARLARLGDETVRLLTLAAVIGQDVPLPLWAATAEVDEDALLDAIDTAEEAHLVAVAPDGGAVRFAHALIREALYQRLVATRRRRVHRAVAEALLATPSPDADAVASHLRRANDPRAAEWLERAGERAWRAYAWLTAAERYEAALALLEASAATAGQRALLLATLAQLRRYTEMRLGIAYLEEAWGLAEQAGDHDLAQSCLFDQGHLRCLAGEGRRGLEQMRLALPALEALAPADRARLPTHQLQRIGAAELYHRGALIIQLANYGWLAEALALAAPMIARGPGTTARGLHGLGMVYAYQGQPALAARANADARAAYRAAGQYVEVYIILATDILTVAEPYFASQSAYWQPLLAAVQEVEERTTRAQRGGRHGVELPFLLLHGAWDDAQRLAPHYPVCTLRAWLAHRRGDGTAAWADIRRELPDGPAIAPGDDELYIALPLLRLAADLALEGGDAPAAWAWLAAHDRWLAWSGAVLGLAEGALGWAAYHRAAGDPAQARSHAETALAHATEPRQPLALLAARRLLGELDTVAGRHVDAAAHLDAALALADACAAPYERALTLLALAELRAATGTRDSALVTLAEVRATFAELGAAPALARADALAQRLAVAPPAAPVALPFGLTAREVEVLRLVAEGLTDPQVAERLFLSRHTVSAHLRAVYGKLGVTTRTAAARFATDHGLA